MWAGKRAPRAIDEGEKSIKTDNDIEQIQMVLLSIRLGRLSKGEA